MTYWSYPEVRLYQNPWEQTLLDEVVIQILLTAAYKASEWVDKLANIGHVDEDSSFACVILDPTRPRHQVTIEDRLMAMVLFGDGAVSFVANAAAKADAHDRHGRHNGDLVWTANFCLGDGDFAYGNSATYGGAIAGGSGLSEDQDSQLALLILEHLMTSVHGVRQQWVEQQRNAGRSLAWFNGYNKPPTQYSSLHRKKGFKTTTDN